MKNGTWYIAGPMSGLPQFNFPAFIEAAKTLRAAGLNIKSPVELDNEETRAYALASPDGDQSKAPNGETWGDLLSRDVKLIADECSGIIFLDGWQNSRGARLEGFVGTLCDLEFYEYEKSHRFNNQLKGDVTMHQLSSEELMLEIFNATYNC